MPGAWHNAGVRAYLIRHGHAVAGDTATPDAARWLSFSGRSTVSQIGKLLAEQGVQLDALVTSPLVRAVQTAELVAAALGYGGEIESLPALAIGGPVGVIPHELAARGVAVAAVGHEPTIASIANAMCGRAVVSAFRPGQVVCIEDGAPAWTLLPDGFQLRGF